MEPEDTIDYNLRKTWFNISKMYNRTALAKHFFLEQQFDFINILVFD